MLNTIQKITQILILLVLFGYPWYADWYMMGSIVVNALVALLVIHSEFFHVFDAGIKYHWLISFKLFSTLKSVINLEDGDYRKYHIDIFKRLDESYDYYIIIYKRFFPFWIAIKSRKEIIYDDTSIKEIQEMVKNIVRSYELSKKQAKEDRERNRKKVSTSTKLKKWDGLIGDEMDKKVYRREIRLGKLLKNGKKTTDENRIDGKT